MFAMRDISVSPSEVWVASSEITQDKVTPSFESIGPAAVEFVARKMNASFKRSPLCSGFVVVFCIRHFPGRVVEVISVLHVQFMQLDISEIHEVVIVSTNAQNLWLHVGLFRHQQGLAQLLRDLSNPFIARRRDHDIHSMNVSLLSGFGKTEG